MGKYELSLKDYDFRNPVHSNFYCHTVNNANCLKCSSFKSLRTECVLVNKWRIYSKKHK